MPSGGARGAYLTIWALTLLLAGPVWAQNLLANPGFEGALGPDGAPEGWVRYGGGAGTELRLTDEAFAGQSGLLLVDHADALRDPRCSIGVVQEVPARGGARYQALVRARPVFRSDDRAVILQLQFVPSERDFIAVVAPKLEAGFQVANLLALAPEDTTSVRLFIYSANIARSETIIDQVSLVELSPDEYRKYAPLEPYNSSGIAEVYPILRQTVLAEDGEARATIIAAKGTEYLKLAERLQRRLRARSGAELPVVVDVTGVDLAARPHVIALGKMSNNDVIERLYWTKAAAVDSVWPGPGGCVGQTVTSPYAFPEAQAIIVLGGSTPEDVEQAIEAFVEHLDGHERLRAPNRRFVRSPRLAEEGDGVRPSSPSRALGAFIESASAYVRGSPHTHWKRALLYLADCHAEDPGLTLSEGDVNRAAELFYLWQAVEGDEALSDEERLVITNALLAILYSLPARIPGYHRLDVRPTIISPETSRPLLGLYYGARYFWHHYGNVDERIATFLRKCEQAFGAQYRSYKCKADVAGPQTRALGDTVEYALNENDLSMFSDGTVRQWADYTSLIAEPDGLPAHFGAQDRAADAAPPERLEEIALPYALWYHRDSEDLARLQELVEGYATPYHDDLEARPPQAAAWSAYAPMTAPVFNLRLPKATYDGPGQAPTVSEQRAFDKLALRTTGPTGQYLLLDGYGRGEGGHYDTNAIASFVDRGVECLVDGGQWARSTTQHSMLTVLKDGFAPDTVPPAAAVLHQADFRDLSIVQTVVRDYNGVDWYRNLFWRHGGPMLVLDSLQSQADGSFQFDCNYMVNTGRQSRLENGVLSVPLHGAQPGEPVGLLTPLRGEFHLLTANDAAVELMGARDDAPGQCVRQRRRVELGQGGVASFQNMLCTSQLGATRDHSLHRAGERASVISGPAQDLAYAGIRGAQLPYDDVVLGADVFYVTPERLIAMNLGELSWGRLVMSAKGFISIDLDLRTGLADVIAEAKGLLRIMGEREGEVRVDGEVVPAKYHRGELLTVPIEKGRHAVEVNPWVVDESLIARIAADLEDLKAAAPQYVDRRPIGQSENTVELWSGPPADSPVGPLLVRDVNDDGIDEILLAAGRQLRCLAPDGTQLWSHDAGDEVLSLEVAPRDMEGGARLLLTTDGCWWALTASGQQVWWHQREELGLPRHRLRTASDIRVYEASDGRLQILAAHHRPAWAWLDDHGRVVRSVAVDALPTTLEVADLNGDRIQEVMVGTMDGKLRIFSPEGEEMPGTEVEPGELIVKVADLNNDGAAEMLVGSTGGVFTATPFGGRPAWTFANYGYGPVDVALGDIDRDGRDEIALASDSGYLYVLGPDGQLEFMDRAGGPVNCVAIGHLVDKRRLAVCYGSDDGSVYIVDGKGKRQGQFWIGQPVKRLALADLTGDGLAEAIAAGAWGDLHVLKYEKGAGVARED